jgi:AraC family transcriptional activator of pobA
MAKATIHKVPVKKGRAANCSCFFVNFGSAEEAYHLPVHHHAFWQMELGTVGRFTVKVRARRTEIRPGLCVFLPPGTRHGFSYPRGIGYLSLKFHAEGPSGEPRSLDLRGTALLRSLERGLLAAARGEAPAEVIDHLLSALFAVRYAPRDQEDQQGSLVARARDYVRGREGRYVTVKQVAEEVGYSASHFSALFRREAGEALKTFLDRERARHAARLVAYSDLSFGRIAYLMGFPDVFAFSRFFKRLHGRAPRAFRRAARTMTDG